MNVNNRAPAAPVNTPITLRPKLVPVSPIKAPLGNVGPQPSIPIISSHGHSQQLFSGNTVQHVYKGTSISRAGQSVNQAMINPQAVYPCNVNVQTSQPRITLFPQSTVSQGIPRNPLSAGNIGTLHQTVPMPQNVMQQRQSTPVVYPQIIATKQSFSSPQSQVNPQMLYRQTIQLGSQVSVQPSAQILRHTVPLVQSSSSVTQNRIPIVQKSVPMLVNARPLYQTMNFPTQVNPQIQTRQQFAVQNPIGANVISPVLSRGLANVIKPFQGTFQGSSNINTIIPAHISKNPSLVKVQSLPIAPEKVAENPGLTGASQSVNSALSQQQSVVSSQPLSIVASQSQNMDNNKLQNTIPSQPLNVFQNQLTDMVPNQMLPELSGPSESPASSDQTDENLSVAKQQEDNELSDSSKMKVLVKPATIIVKPLSENSSVPEDLVQLCTTDSDMSGILSESGSYEEMSLQDSLISDPQFALLDEKNYQQGSPLIPMEQDCLSDSVAMEAQDSPSAALSSLVSSSEMEDILSLQPSFDAKTGKASTDIEYQEMTDVCVPAVTDQIPKEYMSGMASVTSKVVEASTTDEDKVSGGFEPELAPSVADTSENGKELIKATAGHIGDETSHNPGLILNKEKQINSPQMLNHSEIAEVPNGVKVTFGEDADPNSETEPVTFNIVNDTVKAYSSVESELKTTQAVMADTFCQVCSSAENSQDGTMSSDFYDQFTDDSNSITWENFHHSVLNLRARKSDDSEKQAERAAPERREYRAGFSYGDNSESLDERDVHTREHTLEPCHEQSFEDDEEEPEFIWEDFLQKTGTSAVPPNAFKHVEYSLKSGFIKGTKLEVPNKSDPSTFWVSSVLMTCGPLLRLRYDGYGEDSSGDFWCDLNTTEIHPIGWSAQNGKNLQPPTELQNRVSDWRSFLLESLTGARTAPTYFFEKGAALSPVDQLRCGMKLELQDALNPYQVWLVQILENVGGRLYLRLEGTQSACKHFWMFYLNHRLHPIGWAKHQEGCLYRPPKDIFDEQTEESWAEILQTALKECETEKVPDDVFKDQQELKPHQFVVGMKMEALIPGMNLIGPATVTRVINNLYFIIEIDDLRCEEQRESIQVCCNSEYLGIFAVSWCQCKGIRLCPPQGWKGGGDFVWGEYLSFCNAKAAPEKLFHSGTDDHDFERGMKLEAVNPGNPNQICAATITKIVGPLLYIHLDHLRDIPSHIEDIDSHNLFPVGWCESNNYLLKPPVKSRPRQRRSSECKTEEVYRSITSNQKKGCWCPKIYLNHRCFSGPYLSKGRISDLPKYVGPGPLDLVLKEVLGLLVSIAYVPCRALKELQHDGPLNPYMKLHTLKAKYKGKKYKADVEVCAIESYLEDFCRNTCIKLECCPYLFSPLQVRNNCPENCQQLMKTKSNANYVKKKKPGSFILMKPRLQQVGNGEPKKRGRKRKQFFYTQKKVHKSYDGPSDMKDEGFIDDYDYDERKGYDIQTRGAKLPKYSFERKSHRKILLSHPIQQPEHSKQGYKRLLPKSWKEEKEVCHGPPLVPREGSLRLQSNPLYWKVSEVLQFLKTTDCSHLARIIQEQEVDGQAFLLLNLSTIQEHLELKLGPAVKLCHQIERLKLAFYENYA